MMRDPQSEIFRELDTGERLLWAGKPKEGIVFRSIDIFLIPFSIFWCGFAFFWMGAAFFGVSQMEQDGHGPGSIAYLFPLFGLPFVLIGLYLVLGRFWVDMKQREKTYYGVTTERVILISGLFSRSVKSLNLRTLSDMTLTEKSDGSGTINFGSTFPFAFMMQGMNWMPGMDIAQGQSLNSISNAKEVYRIIREQPRLEPS